MKSKIIHAFDFTHHPLLKAHLRNHCNYSLAFETRSNGLSQQVHIRGS